MKWIFIVNEIAGRGKRRGLSSGPSVWQGPQRLSEPAAPFGEKDPGAGG